MGRKANVETNVETDVEDPVKEVLEAQGEEVETFVEGKEITVKVFKDTGKIELQMTGQWKVKEINGIPYQLIKAYRRQRYTIQKQAKGEENG
jgi:hypothetical protein